MDSSVPIQILCILLLLMLSAFFSSAETAMTAVNRIRIQSLAEEGDKRAILLEKIISDSSKMLSTILIGNNVVNMAVSALTTALTIQLWGNVYVGAATGILTILVLIFGEITPKTLATLHADKLALAYVNVIYTLMVVLTPVIFLVGKLAELVMLLLHVDPNAKPDAMTEQELRTLVNESEENGVIESEEKEMINNVFDFGDSTAREVMVPRIDMTFISVDSTREELLEIFRQDMHTRFPVYEDNTDNVIGIINMKDLILLPEDQEFSIRTILREPYFTYEHKATADLLLEMRKAAVNLAIVLDEYGSTAGLVTLEDLLEEIVGEIRDEYDVDEEEEIREIIPEREYLILGSANLDDINEKLDIQLVSEEYDSTGGFIIEQLDTLPSEGETLVIDEIKLQVEQVEKNRIELVRVVLPEKKEETEE
ncbi:MAG: HlyC/CorC family transporter [Clostridiales bacterium]|nr:HlyC/CorC family transporter [Candidatus Blautia equi]